MASNPKDTGSNPLAAGFGWLGAIVGFLAGTSTGELGPALVGAIVVGLVGVLVGTILSWIIARVLFVLACLVMLAISPAGRLLVSIINHSSSTAA